MAGTVPDSTDMLMIVANVGTRMFVFVGYFLTNKITSSVAMLENALTEQDGSQCT